MSNKKWIWIFQGKREENNLLDQVEPPQTSWQNLQPGQFILVKGRSREVTYVWGDTENGSTAAGVGAADICVKPLED